MLRADEDEDYDDDDDDNDDSSDSTSDCQKFSQLTGAERPLKICSREEYPQMYSVVLV